MAIRQEQVVLIGAALLVGYMAFFDGQAERRSTSRGGAAPEFEHHPTPDVSIARPAADGQREIGRDLFSAPRDTRPMPELELVPPPLEPLALLRPSPGAGPRPSLFGSFLRDEPELAPDPGLFVEEEPDAFAEASDEFAVSEEDLDESLMTVEERQALLASYKATYDWIDIGNLHFGRIQNRDRFGLDRRPEEPVRFVEINPATGAELMSGHVLEIERERVEAFAFADNVENRIELARLEFDGQLTQGKFSTVLQFAHECFLQRFETPRALEVAREMFGKAAELTTEDPTPILGLAACAEADFDFEGAFRTYKELVDGRFGKHPRVLARLAQLEARFRLRRQAREHFEAAEDYGRTEWYVQWRYGVFLLEEGEVEAAVEHLDLAARFEPSAAEFQSLRAAIRTDLGNALVAAGRLDDARGFYTRALQADDQEQRATAGLLNVAYLTGEDPGQVLGEFLGGGGEGAGFELLLASGLAAIESGELATAKTQLELAAETDPLRAGQAWRALSFLAEITGNEAEALAYIDQAQANDPTDVWSLYQLGRILAQNDDTTRAMQALTKALDLELELPDALSAIGLLEMEQGNHEAAERYLERAVGIDSRLRSAFTLRGLNALHLGRPAQALEHFDRALVLGGDDPVANIGQAWCAYALGDPTEAKTLLREFADSRRHLGEEDVYRLYAAEQIDRIGAWQEKVVWTDPFERQELLNGWKVDEMSATKQVMRDGKVAFEGSFDRPGRTRIKRFYTSGDFVSLEAELTVRSGNTSRVGVFVALEQKRGSRSADQTTAEVTLSRHPQDKKVQYRSMRRGREDDPHVDSEIMAWPDEQPVLLRLERVGESAKTAFRISIDGVPIADRVPMPSLGATTREIVVGVFAEGEPGRTVSLEIDNVEIVKKER